MFEQIAYAMLQEEFWKFIFVMCRALYAPMSFISLDDHSTPSMDKLYYFVLWTEHMIPIWLENAEDWSKCILTEGLKNSSR